MISTYATDLIRKGSVEEIVGRRDRALELFGQGLRMMAEAHKAAKAASETTYSLEAMYDRGFWYRVERSDIDGALADVRRELDAKVWRYLRDATGLRGLMDAAEIDKFEADLRDPAEVTIENVTATFRDKRDNADAIFVRGLINLFRSLDTKAYRTNDAFKIGPKVVMKSVLGPFGWNIYTKGRDHLADLDRVMHVLDGKPAPDHRGNACAALSVAHRSARAGTVQTEYLDLRYFKNGNVHVAFRRLDLVEKANRMIAEHYGPALAAA